MDLEEIKDEYRARVEPRGKSISEILEEAAKETKAYKDLEQENKKLKRQIDDRKDKYSRLDRIAGENVITLDVMNADIIELKEENEELKEKLNKAGLEEYGFFNEY